MHQLTLYSKVFISECDSRIIFLNIGTEYFLELIKSNIPQIVFGIL